MDGLKVFLRDFALAMGDPQNTIWVLKRLALAAAVFVYVFGAVVLAQVVDR